MVIQHTPNDEVTIRAATAQLGASLQKCQALQGGAELLAHNGCQITVSSHSNLTMSASVSPSALENQRWAKQKTGGCHAAIMEITEALDLVTGMTALVQAAAGADIPTLA